MKLIPVFQKLIVVPLDFSGKDMPGWRQELPGNTASLSRFANRKQRPRLVSDKFDVLNFV
jgi:hypothetical protein